MFAAELRDEKHSFSTFVLDTIDALYDMAFDYTCERLGVEHPGDTGHGKGWKEIAKEFSRVMRGVCTLGMGVIFISHSKRAERKTKTETIHIETPTLTEQPKRLVLPLCDLVLLADTNPLTSERVIRPKCDPYTDSGSRMEQILPDELPLTYAALEAALRGKSIDKKRRKK